MSNLMQQNHWQTSANLNTSPHHDDVPILQLVHKILSDAIHFLASDIHFEPYETSYRVRFRVDGVLREVPTPPAVMASRISSCIKIMSHLDIAEKRIPQDGRFRLAFTSDKPIDFRVSTCPSNFGEKIVIRILDFKANDCKLTTDELGLNKQQKGHFLNAIQSTNGLILVTGPTGSGKTATLYSALHELNTNEVNIVTVEDPVEITLTGIHQVNIHPKIGLTFSKVMRAFLRQDPDIIMLGEMRCKESSEIAIKAAETGHLVLSTLHCQSAVAALTRLYHMGILPHYLASSLKLIIAQRLVRRLCDTCKLIQEEITEQDSFFLHNALTKSEGNPVNFYQAKVTGCPQCLDGYRGRVGIFEVLPISKGIAKLILSNTPEFELSQQAQKEGMHSLYYAAVEKIRLGVTSIAEVKRLGLE